MGGAFSGNDCYTLHRPLESVSTLLMDKANRGERDRLTYVRLRASSTRDASVYGISDWD
jgi:hypothetical protein